MSTRKQNAVSKQEDDPSRSIPERGEAGECTLNKAVRMRAVRCNACGTKALSAASKCPGCGHMFEVRDGFGELLPLAYCSSCDSYYPESVGSCKWCGTKPEPAPIGPYVWKGVGVAALVALLGGAWLMRDSRPKHGLPPALRTDAGRHSAGRSTRPPPSTRSLPTPLHRP